MKLYIVSHRYSWEKAPTAHFAYQELSAAQGMVTHLRSQGGYEEVSLAVIYGDLIHVSADPGTPPGLYVEEEARRQGHKLEESPR